ncbi:uroporphyrinogen-III synthase [Chitinophaga sp. 212800010-3]|uniref:uroporphyrinogen-III synthase n=1 Tax=unclassified Chitinophaga TaxID=2619133 RepID=UPI002DE81FA2|nr:Uroporphyrinogen-III synthase [Chitinophaga sp. 212800010-3]
MPDDKKYRVLCTRPLPETLLAVAREKGIDIDIREFIQIKPLTNTALRGTTPAQWGMAAPGSSTATATGFVSDIFQAPNISVFTSANALKVLEQHYFLPSRFRPGSNELNTCFNTDKALICCISGNTLKKAGEVFREATILASAPYGSELAAAIIARGDINTVNFYCGNQRRDELPGLLRAAGITVNEYVIYENAATPQVVADDYDGILFFSPSAVKSYLSANRLHHKTVCFAIGRTTATTLQEHTDNRIIVSTSTSDESMVQTAIFYFNNINCYE